MGRAAEAMLRALGGGEVALRFTVLLADATSSGNARLATATPTSEDVVLAPVVVRTLDARGERAEVEFVIPASVLAPIVEQRQAVNAEALFRSAAGIVHQEKLFRITNVSSDFYGGAAYLYRVSACE